MRLPGGEFFGETDRQVQADGLKLLASRYRPFEEQPWHTHEHPGFFVHFAGEQLDEWHDAETTMPIMSLTYHPTVTPHRSRIGPRGARGVNIEVSEAWLEKREIDSRELGQLRFIASERVKSSALKLVAMYGPSQPADSELGDMALELIEAFVVRDFPRERTAPKWLLGAEQRMRSEYRNGLGLSALAREAGVHPVHLARVFRERHGKSVTDYLQQLRIQFAVSQILEGDSIGSAALDAGFYDQFHFSRTLKSHYGFSAKLVKALCC